MVFEEMTDQKRQAVGMSKEKLTGTPVLILPQGDGKPTVANNACDQQLVIVLM